MAGCPDATLSGLCRSPCQWCSTQMQETQPEKQPLDHHYILNVFYSSSQLARHHSRRHLPCPSQAMVAPGGTKLRAL